MSRIARRFVTLVCAVAVTLALPTTAALAQVPRPDSADAATGATAVVVHAGSNAGVGLVAVTLIAASAALLGIALSSAVHAMRRNRSRSLAAA